MLHDVTGTDSVRREDGEVLVSRSVRAAARRASAGHLSRRYSGEGLRARHRRRRVSPRRRRHALRQARRRVRAPLVHLRRHRDNARRVAIRGPREHLACTDDNPTLIERPIELLSVPPATSPADFVEMATARQPRCADCLLPRAANGHATTARPSSAMNSRRFTQSRRRRRPAALAELSVPMPSRS